jgi:Mn2+/Fe2+ NRAMP family transporter
MRLGAPNAWLDETRDDPDLVAGRRDILRLLRARARRRGTIAAHANTDAGGIPAGLEKYAGKAAGVMFAIALIDASLIGAAAVSLSTAYAIGDVFSVRHSLHRGVSDAKAFYAVYGGLIMLAAALVLTPSMPPGMLTNAVQALAGVLLPSPTVFLRLPCIDRAALGPWRNGRAANLFTGAVIAALVIPSVILTASVLFLDQTDEKTILAILIGGGACAFAVSVFLGASF